MESISIHSHPKISIDLAGQEDGFVASYSTWDRIDGTVTIEADHDIQFDDIDITFEGKSKTSVERPAYPGAITASHSFLKLRHPVEDSAYPAPRVLKAGHTYRFPFSFVVPDCLLPQVCKHHKSNSLVELAHTQLPPSLGDPMVASDGKTLLDDMSSDMCRISYAVRASIRKSFPPGKTPRILASVGKKVRIIPAVDEDPPMDISDHAKMYSDWKEKDVRRGFMRGKFGRITMTAAQPRPIQLSARTGEKSESTGTVVTVQLRFEPVGNEDPPALNSLSSKLRVSTAYSMTPMETFPSGDLSRSHLGQAMYLETVPLSTLCLGAAHWTRHTDSHKSLLYYTASIVVPIALPDARRAFVPTFHSCLVSRFYALDVSVSYRTPAANIVDPSVSLRLPVQLTCERKIDRGIYYPVDEEIDEIFLPRSVAPPSEYTQ